MGVGEMNTLIAFILATALFVLACFVLFFTVKKSTKGFIIFGIFAFSVSASVYVALLKILINGALK